MKACNYTIYFSAFFLILCDSASASGSLLLRPPMIFKKAQEDKRVTLKETNPFLYLLRKQGNRGNITIDDHTIVICMGGGDCNGLNTFIARTAKKAHARGDKVIVVLHGLKGLLAEEYEDNLFEITPELAEKLDGLPSVASGSSRKKIDPKEEKGAANIEKIIEIVKPAKKVIFIGGNDHLRLTKIAADRIKRFNSEGQNIKTKIIGVSKSVDNDFRNRMHGFWTAFMAGRKIVKRASVQDNGAETRVFESFGRMMGALNLEMSKACPYSKAVLNPEKKVSIQEIIDAWNKGVRNFFVSEGYSLSEKDPRLDELLRSSAELRIMWNKALSSPNRDEWGHPKLTGASLYVSGIIEHFCKARPGKTDLTYQLRGAFSEKDRDGRNFEEFLAEGLSDVIMQDIGPEENGIAIVYNGDYGEYDRSKFGIKPAEEVYETISLKNLMTDEEMAGFGVLGTEDVVFKADPVSVPEEDISLERAMRKTFYANAVSTAAHTYASVMEFRQSSEDIVAGCGRLQPLEIADLPYDLGTAVQGTQDSVLILIPVPERQVSFYEIAKRIKEAIDTTGYVNIAVSNRFALDPDDFLLKEVIHHNSLLAFKLLKAKREAQKKGEHFVTFDSGVSQFILELFKYLKYVDMKDFTDKIPYAKYKELGGLKINFDSTRMTNTGYAFEGLASSSDIKSKRLLDTEFLKAQGVVIPEEEGIIIRKEVDASI